MNNTKRKNMMFHFLLSLKSMLFNNIVKRICSKRITSENQFFFIHFVTFSLNFTFETFFSWSRASLEHFQRFKSQEYPAGDTSRNDVLKSNLQVAITVQAFLIAWLRDVQFVLENPQDTVAHWLSPFFDLLMWLFQSIQGIASYMIVFGHKYLKPVSFWGTWEHVEALGREKPKNTQSVPKLMEKRGKWFQPVDRKAMKESQEYTVGFGDCVISKLEAAFKKGIETPDDLISWAELVNLIDDMIETRVPSGTPKDLRTVVARMQFPQTPPQVL